MSRILSAWLLAAGLFPVPWSLGASVSSSDIFIYADDISFLPTAGTSPGYSVPNASLLYDSSAPYADTNRIIINVDGTPYDILSMTPVGALTTSGSGLGAYIQGTLQVVPGVDLIVRYEIASNPQTGTGADTVKVKLCLNNSGGIPRSVAGRLVFDTMVNGYDGSNISVDNGATTEPNNIVFSQSAGNMPPDWWAYDGIIPPLLVARGSLGGNAYGEAATPPDAFEVADWSAVSGFGQWATAGFGSTSVDSATVLWWTGTGSTAGLGPSLNPGGQICWVTYYGINSGVFLVTLTPTLSPTPAGSPTPTLTPTLTPPPSATLTPTLTPTPGPVVLLSKSVEPSYVYPGEELRFILNFSVSGTGQAQSAVLRDAYPPELIPEPPVLWAQPSPGILEWPLGNLSPGDAGVFTLTFRASSAAPRGITVYNRGTLSFTNPWNSLPGQAEDQAGVLIAAKDGFSLSRNAFRPAVGDTLEIGVGLALGGRVKVTVYNTAGEIVHALVQKAEQTSSQTTLWWDGKNSNGDPVAAGVYVVRVEAPSWAQSRRVVILR